MSSAPLTEPRGGCGRGEFFLFLAVSAAYFAAMIWATDARILFTRHYWLDEFLTSKIVLDPGIIHSIKAVRGGVDTNPPVYHLLLRAFYAVVRGTPETTFRIFSGLCMWGALAFTYATLRRSFAIIPAGIAILALTAHPLLIKQSSDARFYAPLMLGAAAFAFFFCGEPSRFVKGWLRCLLIAAAAVLTCTLHYFGGLAVIAVVAGDLLARGPEWRKRRPLLIPAAMGPLALIAMIPLFAIPQREGLQGVPTWIDDVTFDGAATFFSYVFDMRAVGLVVFAWWASLLWRARQSGFETPTSADKYLRPVAGLGALFTVPFAIFFFSLLVQPSLVAKYAIAGSLAMAPIVALLATRSGRFARVVVALAIVSVAFFQTRELARHERGRDQNLMSRGRRWRGDNDKHRIVQLTRGPSYMLRYSLPKLAPRLVVIDMSSTGLEPISRFHAYEMVMAKKVARFYPELGTVPPDALRGRVFAFNGSADELEWLGKAVPIRKAANGLYRVPATDPADPASTTPAAPAPATTVPASAGQTGAQSDRPAVPDDRQ